MCFKTRCGSIGISHFVLKCYRKKFKCIHKCRIKVTRKVHISEKMLNANRTTSRFEAHLVFKHTQKPDFLISNAR